jgi:hypothetical protein
MEDYFGSRLDAQTSHGICPDCAKEQFSDLEDFVILEDAVSPNGSSARAEDSRFSS